jgi:signal transduction histidine kinase/ActR/RegA family two-component response regulator
MTLGDLSVWYFLLDEIVLVGLLITGVAYFTSKSLLKIQRAIASEIKVYLEQTLHKQMEKIEQGRQKDVETVGNEVVQTVGQRLEQVKEELKQALADKVIAQDAQVIAQYAQVEAEDAQGVAEDAQGVAEDANQAKTDFLSRMSHEIRTPINGIIGSLDLINLDEVTPIQGEDIQRAVDSSNRLLSVINEILNFSSLEAGATQYECDYINLINTAEEIIDSLQPLAQEKELTLRLNLDTKIMMETTDRCGDKQKIGQVMTNLLGNAIKFTNQGEIVLSIKVLEDKWIRFEVLDTGIGISSEMQETLFEPFSQADESNSRNYGGTGLGLSISKKFVEGMDGKIGVESQENIGSSFWFELEMCKNRCQQWPQCSIIDDKRTVSSQELKLVPTVISKDVKVLIVDDDVVNRAVAKRVLEQMGCQTDEAVNGKTAIRKFNNNKFQLIIMDLQMPKMDGFEASRKIRKLEDEQELDPTPILALSASVLGEVEDQCYQAGMDDYIGKPFKKDVLISKINRLVNME